MKSVLKACSSHGHHDNSCSRQRRVMLMIKCHGVPASNLKAKLGLWAWPATMMQWNSACMFRLVSLQYVCIWPEVKCSPAVLIFGRRNEFWPLQILYTIAQLFLLGSSASKDKKMVYRTKIEDGGKLLWEVGWNFRYAGCRHRQAKRGGGKRENGRILKLLLYINIKHKDYMITLYRPFP